MKIGNYLCEVKEKIHSQHLEGIICFMILRTEQNTHFSLTLINKSPKIFKRWKIPE